MAVGADFDICSVTLGRYWMSKAPASAAGRDERPPMTAPTSKVMENITVKLSGATNCHMIAAAEPATPVNKVDTPKVMLLTLATSMPMEVAAIGLSRMACMAL